MKPERKNMAGQASRKALSALVVTIVLVAFAIAAGLIVFSFSAGLVKFQTTSVSTQAVCAQKGSLFLDSSMCVRVRDNSLVGYWKMDSVNASNYTLDSTNYRNDGKLFNGSASCFNLTGCINLTAGQINNGLQFDGVDDYVDAGNASSLNITNAITVLAWVSAPPTSITKSISARWDTGANKRGWRLGTGSTNTDKLLITLSQNGLVGTSYKQYKSSVVAYDGTYKQVGFTFNGSVLSLYINGALDTNPTKEDDGEIASLYGSNAITTIGSHSSSGTGVGFFNGAIDEVRIYNRSLSADEIQQLYQKGLEKFAVDGYFKTIKASVRNIGTTPLSNLTIFADVNGRLYQNSTPLNGGATLPAASEPLTLEAYTYYDGPIKMLKVSVLNCPISTTLSNDSATVGTC